MSCGVGHRCSSDSELLWLWHRLAAAALIRSLAWEPPYAASEALKKKMVLAFIQTRGREVLTLTPLIWEREACVGEGREGGRVLGEQSMSIRIFFNPI